MKRKISRTGWDHIMSAARDGNGLFRVRSFFRGVHKPELDFCSSDRKEAGQELRRRLNVDRHPHHPMEV